MEMKWRYIHTHTTFKNEREEKTKQKEGILGRDGEMNGRILLPYPVGFMMIRVGYTGAVQARWPANYSGSRKDRSLPTAGDDPLMAMLPLETMTEALASRYSSRD